MMWEIIESDLKMQIEFKWSHILVIRASYNLRNRVDPNVLEIEVHYYYCYFVYVLLQYNITGRRYI